MVLFCGQRPGGPPRRRMLELAYHGHYTVKSRGITVYAVNPPLTDGLVKHGDHVKIGEVVLVCAATEHFMTRSHPIIGIAVKGTP